MNDTMQALILKRYGADGLHIADVPRPTIGPDEILVRVHAAGINPIDNMIPKGMFKPILKFDLPAVMGSDLAGTVVEVGGRVSRFQVGDAVYASVFDLGRGSFAEFVAVPERVAARKPANVGFVEAASLPMVGLTAWQAFKERLRLEPGQKVFIPAGSGGIGTFAIQLAKQLGATVGTTSWCARSGPTTSSITSARRSSRSCKAMMPCWARSGATAWKRPCASSGPMPGSSRWSARRMRHSPPRAA